MSRVFWENKGHINFDPGWVFMYFFTRWNYHLWSGEHLDIVTLALGEGLSKLKVLNMFGTLRSMSSLITPKSTKQSYWNVTYVIKNSSKLTNWSNISVKLSKMWKIHWLTLIMTKILRSYELYRDWHQTLKSTKCASTWKLLPQISFHLLKFQMAGTITICNNMGMLMELFSYKIA